MSDGEEETLYGLDDRGDVWVYAGQFYEAGDMFRGRKVKVGFYTKSFWRPFDMSTINPERLPNSWSPSWLEDRLEKPAMEG